MNIPTKKMPKTFNLTAVIAQNRCGVHHYFYLKIRKKKKRVTNVSDIRSELFLNVTRQGAKLKTKERLVRINSVFIKVKRHTSRRKCVLVCVYCEE